MKIINKTLWRTDHLRAIFQRAAEMELEPEQRKRLIVTVEYTRGGLSSGCVPRLKSRYATIRVRHPESRSARRPHDLSGDTKELRLAVASVAVHEFAHNRGMDHDKMPDKYKWTGSWREYVAWAADMPLDVKPVKAKPKATTDDKLAHVRKMKAAAETRAKRALTILKKWKRKEQYYLKQVALRPERTNDPAVEQVGTTQPEARG